MKNRSKKIDDELAALVRMRNEDIDTSDIPETLDWTGAAVGKFYRPVKEAVSLRVDADVLAWLKGQGPGYQTRINDLLRGAMKASRAAGKAKNSGAATETAVPETKCRSLRYQRLERHGEMQRCIRVAEAITERQCLFAPIR